MAEEILRSKHAFGNIENLQAAIDAKLIDEYDILFLKDIDGKARIGWIDKDGNVVLVTDEKADLSQVEADVDALELNVDALENEMAKKADAAIVNAELNDLNAGVAGIVTNVTELETAIEAKVDAITVQSMIEQHVKSMIEVVEF